MLGRILSVTMLAAALLWASIQPVSAAQAVIDEVNLADPLVYPVGGQQPGEINRTDSGNLILSEYGLGFIWEINPVTGQYTLYDFDNGGLTDAHQGPNGAYWFTNNQDTIYYIDEPHDVYYNWVPAFGDGNVQLGSLAVTAQNTIWLADYYGVQNGLYRLINNNGTAEFCSLEPAAGLGSYDTNTIDLIFRDGYLWAFNFQLKKILRLNTIPNNGTFTLETWQTPIPEIEFATLEGWVMDFDDQGNLWFGGDFQPIPSDPENYYGIIYRFNPNTKEFSAFAVPQIDTATLGISILNGKVWFANFVGLIGEMDPQTVTPYYLAPISEANHSTIQLSASCTSFPSNPAVMPGYIKQGTLPFIDKSYTLDNSHPGWMLYQVPDSYSHFGINQAQGNLLVSGRNQSGGYPYLIRLSPPSNQYAVFLPLIKR